MERINSILWIIFNIYEYVYLILLSKYMFNTYMTKQSQNSLSKHIFYTIHHFSIILFQYVILFCPSYLQLMLSLFIHCNRNTPLSSLSSHKEHSDIIVSKTLFLLSNHLPTPQQSSNHLSSSQFYLNTFSHDSLHNSASNSFLFTVF